MGRQDRRFLAPTLGVTGVLALLWLFAAVAWGPTAPAAVALDPGHAGSVGAIWGAILLTGAALVAATVGATRPLALALFLLWWWDSAQVHATVADLVAAKFGAPEIRPWLRAGAVGSVGAVVLAAALQCPSRPGHSNLPLIACAIGGCAAVGVDLASASMAPWSAPAEEWLELGVYAVLAGWALSLASILSQLGTK